MVDFQGTLRKRESMSYFAVGQGCEQQSDTIVGHVWFVLLGRVRVGLSSHHYNLLLLEDRF